MKVGADGWNFVASGLVFVSSSVFQGLGNTLPALATVGEPMAVPTAG